MNIKIQTSVVLFALLLFGISMNGQSNFPKCAISLVAAQNRDNIQQTNYTVVGQGLSPSFRGGLGGQLDLELTFRICTNAAVYVGLGGGSVRERFSLDFLTTQSWITAGLKPIRTTAIYNPATFGSVGTGLMFNLYRKRRSTITVLAGFQATFLKERNPSFDFAIRSTDGSLGGGESSNLGSIKGSLLKSFVPAGRAGFQYAYRLNDKLSILLGVSYYWSPVSVWETDINLTIPNTQTPLLVGQNTGKMQYLAFSLGISHPLSKE